MNNQDIFNNRNKKKNVFLFAVRFPCEPPQFSCLTEQMECINMSQIKDNVVHCSDASDEGKKCTHFVRQVYLVRVCLV